MPDEEPADPSKLQDDLVYPMTIDTVVDSWKVAYLDDVTVAKQAFKTQNTQTLASLVWEFFEFWAWKHSYPHDVISIRKGRIVSKASKDWTKRIGRDRHLVCVEDPFVVSTIWDVQWTCAVRMSSEKSSSGRLPS